MLFRSVGADTDAVSFPLPRGMEVTGHLVTIAPYAMTPGGLVRFFSLSPLQPLGGNSFAAAGSFSVPWVLLPGQEEVGFEAKGASGAVGSFGWQLDVDVVSACTGPGTLIWDEAVDGDIPGDEISPTWFGELSPGRWVVCGVVDPAQDSFTFELGRYARVRSIEVTSTRYATLGGRGLVRTFDPAPFAVRDQADIASDTTVSLGTSGLVGMREVGFTAASFGGSGALYGYRTVIEVEEYRPLVTTTPAPAAGVNVLFEASQLTPGGQVYLAASLNRGSTAIPACPGLTSDLRAPTVIGSGSATRSGTFSTAITIPATLAGRTIYVQAFDRSGCRLSELNAYRL